MGDDCTIDISSYQKEWFREKRLVTVLYLAEIQGYQYKNLGYASILDLVNNITDHEGQLTVYWNIGYPPKEYKNIFHSLWDMVNEDAQNVTHEYNRTTL